MECSNIEQNDAEAMSRLAIKMENCAIALEQMDYTADLNSLRTLEGIVKKLPRVLQMKWAETVEKLTETEREPTFAELTQFVSARASILLSRFGQLATSSRRPDSKIACSTQQLVPVGGVLKPSCIFCGGNHVVTKCTTFLSLPVDERWSKAKETGCCFSCLKRGHRSVECKIHRVCSVEGCKAYHHPLLHKKTHHAVGEQPEKGSCGCTESLRESVCLGLLPVRVKHGNKEVYGYAILDNGSDTTLITKNVLQLLGLSTDGTKTIIKTVSGSRLADSVSKPFEVYSLDGNECILIDRAVVARDLPVRRPKGSMRESIKRWPHLTDVPWTEVEDGEVLLLIGCDVPEAHWVLDQKLGGRKSPYAVRSLLGWVVFGPTSFREHRERVVNCTSRSDLLVDQWKKIYDYEFSDLYSGDKSLSVDDLAAVNIVQRGTYWDNGHFVVPLPWKMESKRVYGGCEVARRRLESLKRRLISSESLRESYTSAMEETIRKGYAAVAPEPQLDPSYRPRWYLPHHAVFNPKKPGKVRVVLDCAAKLSGTSLNDFLYQGPDTTANLVGILLRFRKELIALTSDVEEMFMQVKVPEFDRGALRFLWWPQGDFSKEPIEYQMTSHPFGAVSSPFCAYFAMAKTAETYANDYDSYVVEAVKHNFYVDDCLVSFASPGEAKTFVKQSTELLLRGGFKLKKWVTNSEAVRVVLPGLSHTENSVDLRVSQGSIHRALGLEWDTMHDVFKFRFEPVEKPFTKRGLLSTVSALFDPLGLIAPVCLPAKQLLQNLCKSHAGWDTPLSSNDLSLWMDWMRFMKNLGQISVPRSIKKEDKSEMSKIELHLFCDASESGYGAVAYSWNVPKNTPPYSILLYSKSRVAPLKTVTVPRLELAAAVLSVRMSEILRKNLPNSFDKTYFWTDSMIVLYYIRNTESRYSTFVANRLAIIHQYSSPNQWGYVKSEENPADWTSRGIRKACELASWIQGPSFLGTRQFSSTTDLCWKEPPKNVELKRSVRTNTNVTELTADPILAYHSDWVRLIKAVAWLKRYVVYISVMYSRRQGVSLNVGYLTADELEAARHKVLCMVQQEVYGELIKELREKGSCETEEGELQRLSPILVDGLVCVGGRLNYSDYPLTFKHPVILPRHHFVTELIIRHYHIIEGHTGTSQVLATLRRNYWIIKGISAVKRVIRKCIECRRLKAALGQQMMAPLPVCRVQKGWFCFSSVGIDYFGPLMVRQGRREEKRYGCVFTCLQTRAIHLEVAFNLGTDAFIMAVMRFIGRRGTPAEIYSDNGSNFVGAISELRQLVSVWDRRRINDAMVSKGIRWSFNPPQASHRGGIWERMIRSVRRLLMVISKEQTLHDDTLATYFVEIERILNNRPIVPMTTDPKDELALTPNSLLLLRDSGGIVVEGTIADNYVRRWKQVNYLADVFWRRWMKEYLPCLQTRQKWLGRKRNFKEGDVVIVASEKTPRGSWPLGVIETCEKDEDDLVRTVMVRMKEGTVRRDIRKLCLLEGVEER
ncbi:unnamed protein product [Heterobilharzia americana]|nr:unnamed protein product [Heterobilharzia americana]CAH8287257.1 unnamed protein product [Heterobilharzia americana]CAH8475508.1 unnamed protein product [Heterobilharzia americana]